jgi:Spy/CpxP family protein refolding chaperone
MNRLVASLTVFILMSALACIGSARGPGENREKMQERIELLRKLEIMEKLNLDNETAEKIFAIRRKYLAERKKCLQELRRDFEELKNLLEDKSGRVTDEELKSVLENIWKNRKKLRSRWEDQYDRVSEILTVRQQAELILFLKDFRKSIRSLFRGRDHRPPPGPPRMGQERPRGRFGAEEHLPPPGVKPPDPRGKGPGPDYGSPDND